MNKKISVVIPVRNAERTLHACLGSVMSVDGISEIVIVDNASTDSSRSIMEWYRSAFLDERDIQIISEKRIGRAFARNAGVRATTGDIVCMIDADCEAPSDWLMLTDPIINGLEKVVMGFETNASVSYWSRMVQKADEQYVDVRASNGYISHIDTKNIAFDGEFIRKNLFNENFVAGEDWELYMRTRTIVNVRFMPQISVIHHHPQTITGIFRMQYGRAKYIVQEKGAPRPPFLITLLPYRCIVWLAWTFASARRTIYRNK